MSIYLHSQKCYYNAESQKNVANKGQRLNIKVLYSTNAIIPSSSSNFPMYLQFPSKENGISILATPSGLHNCFPSEGYTQCVANHNLYSSLRPLQMARDEEATAVLSFILPVQHLLYQEDSRSSFSDKTLNEGRYKAKSRLTSHSTSAILRSHFFKGTSNQEVICKQHLNYILQQKKGRNQTQTIPMGCLPPLRSYRQCYFHHLQVGLPVFIFVSSF